MKKIYIMIVILLLIAGCQSQSPQLEETTDIPVANEALQRLLPVEQNFTWRYDGFAEYGHTMHLDELSADPNNGEATYSISGEVDDVSGGEALGDYSISLTYTIKSGQLLQSWLAPRMMDTPYEQIILLQTPLEVDTQWTQQVVNRVSGLSNELICTITQVTTSEGVKSFKVCYKDEDSGYYEERTFKEGYGVVAYAKLINLGPKEFEVGYMMPEAFNDVPL